MNRLGFVDKRRAGNLRAAGVATAANYATSGTVDTRLTAINGTLYSAANLVKMTENDKIYALRVNDDAVGI